MGANEILHGIAGAWRIVLRDAGAARHFNLSAEGFFRSFLALALALPIFFFSTTSLWRMGRALGALDEVDFAAFALARIGGEVLYWAIYLGAMAPISRHLDLTPSYGAYVITFNWGVLMNSLLMALPLFFYSIGIVGGQFASLLTLPVLGLTVWYRWQIARAVLGAPPSSAAAILVLDLTLGALLDQGLGWLLLTPGVA